jgi:hypothetical protein
MTVAERTREAVRRHPFLYESFRAGVVNYTAAARFLDVDAGEEEAVAAALRRYADDLPDRDPPDADATVRMESGLGSVDDAADALLSVAGAGFAPGTGSLTGVVASGEVGAAALARALGVLDARDVTVEAAGVAGGGLAVVVVRRDGPDAVRAVEDALSS